MAKLYKLQNGYYYIFYKQADGKENKVSTKTKNRDKAQKLLVEFLLQNSECHIIPNIQKKQPDSTTLGCYIEKFLAYSKAFHSIKTTNDYRTTFKYFLASVSSEILLSQITLREINEFIEQRICKSIYAARKDVINLKAMFNKAMSDGYLTTNPCVNLKRIKVPEKQPLFFSKDEFNKLLSVVGEKDFYDLILFAVFTGCRQMEILELTWVQIDLQSNMIILNNHSHINKSKRVRSIPLNSKLIKMLYERKKSVESEFVFTYKGKKIKPDYLQDRFRKYIDKASLNSKLHFHSLRHTFASWLVQNGVGIYEISNLLGHSAIKVTEIYTHLSTSQLRRSINVLTN